jgi:hypothetical protein
VLSSAKVFLKVGIVEKRGFRDATKREAKRINDKIETVFPEVPKPGE